jgi:hypothetical protein
VANYKNECALWYAFFRLHLMSAGANVSPSIFSIEHSLRENQNGADDVIYAAVINRQDISEPIANEPYPLLFHDRHDTRKRPKRPSFSRGGVRRHQANYNDFYAAPIPRFSGSEWKRNESGVDCPFFAVVALDKHQDFAIHDGSGQRRPVEEFGSAGGYKIEFGFRRPACSRVDFEGLRAEFL